jgi:hypothetical protein
MAESKSKAKKAPESDDSGARSGFPAHEPRSGHVKRHDRLLTASERRERESKRAAARETEVKAQEAAADDRERKGWAARRHERN